MCIEPTGSCGLCLYWNTPIENTYNTNNCYYAHKRPAAIVTQRPWLQFAKLDFGVAGLSLTKLDQA